MARPDAICDARSKSPSPFHSIPSGLPFSPPPLFFLLGIMENGRTTRTTYDIALLPTYTHYHTLYTHEVRVRNQIPPPLFFPLQPPHPTSSPARTSLSHTHKQKRQLCAPPACPRPPCLPPTDKTDRVRRSRSFTRHKPIFHRGLSFGGFAPLGEEEPLPGPAPACLTYTPPPEPERIYGKKKKLCHCGC